MKTFVLRILFTISIFLPFSCQKNEIDVEISKEDMIEHLVDAQSFIDFSKVYIGNFMRIAANVSAVNSNKKFLDSIRQVRSDKEVEAVFKKYNYDFLKTEILIDEMDVALNKLIHENQQLKHFDFKDQLEIVSLSINKMKDSENQDWVSLKDNLSKQVSGKIVTLDKNARIMQIDPDEVVMCVITTLIGVGLTWEGISAGTIKSFFRQAGLKAVGKLVAKFAGPIGAIITAAYLGACIIDADDD